jgi:hypothetical protein
VAGYIATILQATIALDPAYGNAGITAITAAGTGVHNDGWSVTGLGAATGNGATFTITPPTVSASVRGMMYVAKGLTMEELQALQSLGWIPKDLPATAMIMLQVYGGRF